MIPSKSSWVRCLGRRSRRCGRRRIRCCLASCFAIHGRFLDSRVLGRVAWQVWAERDGQQGWMKKCQLVKKLPPWKLKASEVSQDT